jgi:hypothetical protein
MLHSYEHIVDAQQSSVGDELYNLTQLAEVSIVYFRQHTATIIDGPNAYEKDIKVSHARRYTCMSSLKSVTIYLVACHLTRNLTSYGRPTV